MIDYTNTNTRNNENTDPVDFIDQPIVWIDTDNKGNIVSYTYLSPKDRAGVYNPDTRKADPEHPSGYMSSGKYNPDTGEVTYKLERKDKKDINITATVGGFEGASRELHFRLGNDFLDAPHGGKMEIYINGEIGNHSDLAKVLNNSGFKSRENGVFEDNLFVVYGEDGKIDQIRLKKMLM
jgi:uncharacterized protein YuzE